MNRKWTLFTTVPCDYKGLEEYLNRQAAKGWELEKVGAVFARWRRMDRPSKWCVDLMGVRKSREEKKEYLELCREGGWELLTLRESVCVFRAAPGTNPAPVQTDPGLEKSNYKRYYLRPAILSAIWLLVIIGLNLFNLLFAFDSLALLAGQLRYGWAEHWTVLAFYGVIPFLGLLAVWKLFYFVFAQIRNRGEGIKTPPAWGMWVNMVMSALVLLAGLLVLVGYVLDGILRGRGMVYSYIILGVLAVTFLYRWLQIEKELFPREKRNLVGGAIACAVLLVLSVVGDLACPYGEWSEHGRLEGAPVVTTEELGRPLGEYDQAYFCHEVTPAGERWELEYYFHGSGIRKLGCLSRECLTDGQARRVAARAREEIDWWKAYLETAERPPSYVMISAPPQVELMPVELDWADEAWYGTDGELSVLLLRIDRAVVRLTALQPLLEEETLSVIRGALTE